MSKWDCVNPDIIRTLREHGATIEQISRFYGCSRSTINRKLLAMGIRTLPYKKRGPYLTWNLRKNMTYKERLEFYQNKEGRTRNET